MTVEELIKQLSQIEDKNMEVTFHDREWGYTTLDRVVIFSQIKHKGFKNEQLVYWVNLS